MYTSQIKWSVEKTQQNAIACADSVNSPFAVSSTVLLEVTYNTYVEFLHCIQYVMLTLFFIIIKFEAETQWTNRNKV